MNNDSRTLLLKNGRLLDAGLGLDGSYDILIVGGKVREVGPGLTAPADETIDLAGLWVLPGAIDLHVHLREPGQEYKENLASGTRAAAAGGFTSIACMPNTEPVNDNAAVTRFILEQARRAPVKVLPVAAITQGQRGERLVEMGDLVAAGAAAFSDDGKTVANSKLLRHALEYATLFDKPLLCHCQDNDLFANGVIHEGEVAAAHGLPGIPALAEELDIARTIMLAEYLKVPVHICHLSTRGGVELLRAARARGARVTAEATPHHLFLDERAVVDLGVGVTLDEKLKPARLRYNANSKMSPPLRSQDDVKALRAALKEGLIDAIATDHAPHEATEKVVEYERAPFGVIGLETAVALGLRLVEEGVLTPLQLTARLSLAPAAILGLTDRGTLAPGRAADLMVIDPQAEWVVDPEQFFSKSRNTPFAGWRLRGQVVLTMVDGKTVFDRRCQDCFGQPGRFTQGHEAE
ncbi:MAG TPA: dihydroorotase [Proteobacteria bacterium]|nr:dihydroorotase [Pseudomonadota bacterium]